MARVTVEDCIEIVGASVNYLEEKEVLIKGAFDI